MEGFQKKIVVYNYVYEKWLSMGAAGCVRGCHFRMQHPQVKTSDGISHKYFIYFELRDVVTAIAKVRLTVWTVRECYLYKGSRLREAKSLRSYNEYCAHRSYFYPCSEQIIDPVLPRILWSEVHTSIIFGYCP